MVCNMKNSDEGKLPRAHWTYPKRNDTDFTAHIGDTICHADKLVEALPGFKPMKAMVSFLVLRPPSLVGRRQADSQVYAGVFPVDSGDFSKLEEAIARVS